MIMSASMSARSTAAPPSLGSNKFVATGCAILPPAHDRVEVARDNRRLGPAHVRITGDMPRKVVRQKPVVINDRPGEPPLPYQAVGNMGADRAGADKHRVAGIGRASPREPGGEIALELKVHFRALEVGRGKTRGVESW